MRVSISILITTLSILCLSEYTSGLRIRTSLSHDRENAGSLYSQQDLQAKFHLHHRHHRHHWHHRHHRHHFHSADVIKAAKDAKDLAAKKTADAAAAAQKLKDDAAAVAKRKADEAAAAAAAVKKALDDAAAAAKKQTDDWAAAAKRKADAAAAAAKKVLDDAAAAAKKKTDDALAAANAAAAKLASETKDLSTKLAALADSSMTELQSLADEAIRLANQGVLEPLKVLAAKLLTNALKPVTWDGAKYHEYMTRIPADFNQAVLNSTSNEYSDFNTKAAAEVKDLARLAYKSLPLQDRCQKKRVNWLEYNPMPITALPVFNIFPFSEQNKASWLIEPCNAVSNGAFLRLFSRDVVVKDLRLQYTAFGMCWGSWYFHGDGGFHDIGGMLDTWSIDVMFYYVYMEAVERLIDDDALRKEWADPTGGDYNVSDHKAEADKWKQVMSMSSEERNSQVEWTNPKGDKENMTLAKRMKKTMPNMLETIPAFVVLFMRAIFHEGMPLADELFVFVTDLIIDGLAGGDDKIKKRRDTLSKTAVKGFNDPTRGGVAIIDIFADFLEAMFWQEHGMMGDGAKVLISHVQPNAGCTFMPHSVWHRKAERVIGGFLDAVYTEIEAGTSKNPDTLTTLKNTVGGIHRLVGALAKVANMARANMMKEGAPDFVDTRGLLKEVQRKFGSGWAPPSSSYSNPECTYSPCCARCTQKCTESPTVAPTSNITLQPSRNSTAPPSDTPTVRPTALLTNRPTRQSTPTPSAPPTTPASTSSVEPSATLTRTPMYARSASPSDSPTAMPTVATPSERHVVLRVARMTQASFDARKDAILGRIAQIMGVDISRLRIALKNAAKPADRRLLLIALNEAEGTSEIDVTVQDSTSSGEVAAVKQNVSTNEAVSAIQEQSAAQLSSELGVTVEAVEVVPTGAPTSPPTSAPSQVALHSRPLPTATQPSTHAPNSAQGLSTALMVMAGAVVSLLLIV